VSIIDAETEEVVHDDLPDPSSPEPDLDYDELEEEKRGSVLAKRDAIRERHDRVLTIGEVARRTGIATSALRYYEQLGLLPTPARISGQRRYPESAVEFVGIILLLRDVGFSLAEQKAFMAARAVARGEWRRLAQRKLGKLDEQIAKAQTARKAIDHALGCPHEDILQCSNFRSLIAAALAGQPLHEAHSH
jgi:DNA-binding transcriptional MerR regulator